MSVIYADTVGETLTGTTTTGQHDGEQQGCIERGGMEYRRRTKWKTKMKTTAAGQLGELRDNWRGGMSQRR
jgi:hypothetical protein